MIAKLTIDYPSKDICDDYDLELLINSILNLIKTINLKNKNVVKPDYVKYIEGIFRQDIDIFNQLPIDKQEFADALLNSIPNRHKTVTLQHYTNDLDLEMIASKNENIIFMDDILAAESIANVNDDIDEISFSKTIKKYTAIAREYIDIIAPLLSDLAKKTKNQPLMTLSYQVVSETQLNNNQVYNNLNHTEVVKIFASNLVEIAIDENSLELSNPMRYNLIEQGFELPSTDDLIAKTESHLSNMALSSKTWTDVSDVLYRYYENEAITVTDTFDPALPEHRNTIGDELSEILIFNENPEDDAVYEICEELNIPMF